MNDFQGKGAIVTGAASGIGLGISRVLAKAGVNVAMVDIQERALDAASKEVAALGVRTIAVPLDVSDREAVKVAAARIDHELGKVHLVFNNAGVELGGTAVADVEDREWDWIIGVNVYGVINGIRHFLPLVKKHGEGGHVVNTASVAGFWVNPNFRLGPYATTKFAVVALTEALHQDLVGTNIGVSILAPAAVNTRIFASGSNRPARFGGAYQRQGAEGLQAALASGLAPEEVGERVLRAIRNNELYIFTHQEPKNWFSARFERILAAFP
jgi:NAD(P)-dependent dehydrogenase (short-subunit alcohol dehydrogenase family)